MFLGDLARTKARYPFALLGYCLMSNHFHLLLKPAPGQSISRILQSLTVAHTWRHHRRQGTSGHVWQGRFRSPVIQDGDHRLVVLRYIEANPVRAAMVADPCESTWSSHRCQGAGHADPILWTRSRNGSSSVALSRNVGPAGDRRSVGNNRPRSGMACGRRCAVAGPTVQRTGSRSFPIASASSLSRAAVVVRHAKDAPTPEFPDTGIPLTPEFPRSRRLRFSPKELAGIVFLLNSATASQTSWNRPRNCGRRLVPPASAGERSRRGRASAAPHATTRQGTGIQPQASSGPHRAAAQKPGALIAPDQGSWPKHCVTMS